MGGKNHQPCRAYLNISTRMSRHASLAFAQLELANVALEDLILEELSSSKGDVSDIAENLEHSRQGLCLLVDTMTELRAKMEELDYQDLPSLRQIDLVAIGEDLVSRQMVSAAAWQLVRKNALSQEGFYANLQMLQSKAQSLIDRTGELLAGVLNLETTAESGEVMLVLEENRSGNIKGEFATLYSGWTEFQQLFLASSLLSTEVYYAFNSFGSLSRVVHTKVA